MSIVTQAAKNVGSGWFALVVNTVVGFFLSPFILHRLGDEAFGLWALVFVLTGYYGLFDLGIRSSVVRDVARFSVLGDPQELSSVINTSLFSYGCIALVALLVTGVGCVYIDSFLRIPPSFVKTAQLLLLMVGAAVALNLPLAVFGGALEGLQKFYGLSLTQVVLALIRAGLIVFTLRHGGGLLTIAFITAAGPVCASLVYCFMINRQLPIQYGWRFVSRGTFRRIATYGGTTFMIVVANQLRLKADTILIGIFLSTSAVTYFTIASRLVGYPSDLVVSLAEIFMPMSSRLDAQGKHDRLCQIFVAGSRACAMTIFPVCVTLVILGRSVIEVWVGARYVEICYGVLLTLLLPRTVFLAQATSVTILFGLNRHRVLAVAAMIEGLANVSLSIVFMRYWGLIGDPLGTAIPMLTTTLLFLPGYLCRLLEVPMMTYLKQAYLPALLLCAPLVVVLLVERRLFVAHTYLQLLVQVGIGGVVYSIGALWFFLTKEPTGVKIRLRLRESIERALGR